MPKTKTTSCTFNHPKDWPCKSCNPSAYHDDFKIISNGRELPFPMLRLVFTWALMFAIGFYIGGHQ